MTATRRLAAILAAVGVREHRDGTSESRQRLATPRGARLVERRHHCRGRLGIIRRALRPRPRADVHRERVTVADRREGSLAGMVI
jgi:hypothetical protein